MRTGKGVWVVQRRQLGAWHRDCLPGIVSCGSQNRVPQTGWLKSTHLLSHSSRGQKSLELCGQAVCPLGLQRRVLPASSSSGAPGAPWLVDTSPHPASIFTWPPPLCVCLCIFSSLLVRTPVRLD